MTFSRVQSAAAASDPASATFGATPTEGNLLVAIVAERSGTTEANFTISGSGWTKRIGHDAEIADPNARRTMVVWTKVAGASEPTSVQVDNGTSSTKRLLILEFASDEAVTWTHEASASNDSGTGSTSPLSSGTTGSVSAGDLLVIASAIWRHESSTTPGSIAWTNSLSNGTSTSGATNELTIHSAFKQDAASGTKESEVSWTGAGMEAVAGILVFSATGSAGGAITGSLAVTLGSLTAAATGEVLVSGSLAQTLGGLSLVAEGSLSIEGSLAATLGSLTLNATGEVVIEGSLNQTLGALTLSAQGTSGNTGQLNSTLGPLTLAGTGTVDIAGLLAQALGGLTLAGQGAVTISGSLAVTLDAVTLSAQGSDPEEDISGELGVKIRRVNYGARVEEVSYGAEFRPAVYGCRRG